MPVNISLGKVLSEAPRIIFIPPILLYTIDIITYTEAIYNTPKKCYNREEIYHNNGACGAVSITRLS